VAPATLPFISAYGAIVTAMDTSNVKRAGGLVGADLAGIGRQAAASRDYLVGKLDWPRSVIDRTRSGHSSEITSF
jgi:hypothetical protein